MISLTFYTEQCRQDKFKVYNTLNDWFEEFRLYHRKDGKVVDFDSDGCHAVRGYDVA